MTQAVTARSTYGHILSLGLELLWLGGTEFISMGKIIESRGEAVRHNVKRVRRYVRQPQLRHSNINPNN
jgi:hypothetical protein